MWIKKKKKKPGLCVFSPFSQQQDGELAAGQRRRRGRGGDRGGRRAGVQIHLLRTGREDGPEPPEQHKVMTFINTHTHTQCRTFKPDINECFICFCRNQTILKSRKSPESAANEKDTAPNTQKGISLHLKVCSCSTPDILSQK